ncbi:hypothetical protein N7468_000216 [Penicillium chermesinum]|uniref:Uncharacterized protein n=1 Tax=Penicillium chermesinum TaxID=63820 RepID=A0A9W9TZ28_9EURO|nr:uncharacterized protein N7468_000216 [Penicillium chermesinum]KAJ5248765.1 hypothetical protein N7468_000216 [Penicillium chermesinum]KAJ6150869.1 hypothetical protein N7470_007463 [Penicillium chermesinum]
MFKRLDQITPKDWTADPYFMCYLLALAQLQERHFGHLELPSYTVSLEITSLADKECLLFCEAEISAELLTGLKAPETSVTPVKWPAIRRKKIKFRPYETFGERLVAELKAPFRNEDGTIKNIRSQSPKQCNSADNKRPFSSSNPEVEPGQKRHRQE